VLLKYGFIFRSFERFRLTYLTGPKINRYAWIFIFFHRFLKLLFLLISFVLNITENVVSSPYSRGVGLKNTGYENGGVWFYFAFAQIPSQKIQRQYLNTIHDSRKHSEYTGWHKFMAFVRPFIVLCGFRKRQNIAQCGIKASQASRTLHYITLHCITLHYIHTLHFVIYFVNCNWINTRCQWYSTHNQYIGQHK